MTIKQFIDKFFKDECPFDWNSYTYYASDFWRAWDLLESNIDTGGIQWAFEWYMDEPPLSENRTEFIRDAIDAYIRKNIMPVYTGK